MGLTALAAACLVIGVLSAALLGLRAQEEPMWVLSYGYVDRQHRAALGLIDGARLAEVKDVAFLRAGGELSPDGTRIAYDTCLKADRSIAVARRDGSDVQRLVGISGDGCVNVRWSHEGKWLSYPNRADMRLHIVEVDTGIDLPLHDTTPAFGWHSWSPADDAIVYETGRGGSRRIDIIDLTTSRTRQLVGPTQFGECEVWAPDWSPAGDRIVFTSCDRKLHVVTADGTGLRLLSQSAYAPRWSIDGQWVLFLSGRALLRVPAEGGGVQSVGVLPYHGGPFSLASMSR